MRISYTHIHMCNKQIMSVSQKLPTQKGKGTTVCRRCKDQHIRCDVEMKGIPCSHCQRVGNTGCHLVESKRSRGTNGRFVVNKPNPNQAGNDADSAPALFTNRILCTSERLPPFSIDFEALCGNYHRSPGTSGERSINRRSRLYASTSRWQTSAQPIWGESWYLSFVIQTINSHHDYLYRPIVETHQLPTPIFNQSTNSTSVSYSMHKGRIPKSTSKNGLPPPELIHALLGEYFAIFQSFCPILDRTEFLASVNDETVSKVLLHCALFIASIHCDLKIIHLLGYSNRIEAEDDLFSTAKAAFDSGEEKDRLMLLLCSYLLHYWSGSASKSQDSLWWLACTIRSAQCMEMHRKVQEKTASREQERMWRRIWWLLYIRDRQISIALGKPMIINDDDCDVNFLCEDDLQGESDETISYILAQTKLSIAASQILRSYFTPSKKSTVSDDTFVLSSICTVFSEWDKSVPRDEQHNGLQRSQLALLLNFTSNYYRIIIHQRLLRQFPHSSAHTIQASNDIIINASERITCMTEWAVTHLRARYFPMICISSIFAAMTAQFTQANRSDQSPVQRSSFLNSIKYKLLALKEFEECHVLAGWIRQLFIDILSQHERQPHIAPNSEFTGEEVSREVEISHCIQSLDVLNTGTSLVPDASMATIDPDAITTDISHQAILGISSTSIPSGNTHWNRRLLESCDNISEGAMMEHLLFSLTHN